MNGVKRITISSILILILISSSADMFSIKNANAVQDVIELDQKTYGWTDVVGIAIVAPEYNVDLNQRDTIGGNGHGSIQACTKEDCIPISLLETTSDSGIFTGTITLTGDTGITSHCNPVCDSTSGKLRAEISDQITVTFVGSDGQQIVAYGKIISSGQGSNVSQSNASTSGSSSSSTSSDYSNYSLQHAIPNWVKNTAKWWSEGQVGDSDFIKGTEYLIQQGIIVVHATPVSSHSSHGIPSWIKNTAKWWSEGQVGDSDFIKGIEYLVQNGMINLQNNNNQEINLPSIVPTLQSLPPRPLDLPTAHAPGSSLPKHGAASP